MNDQERRPGVREIVDAALTQDAGDLNAILDTACSTDLSLRREVDSVLAAYRETNNFSSPASAPSSSEVGEALRSIGPYRLVRELGTGGMGQVWLAEQSEPVSRMVALKLIRSGFFNSEITQRFLAERQSLALMNHPAIAKVFDGGTTAAGQPYLVMEYVDGSPITEYCDRVHLPIKDRLRLFQQVCEGVQHAHQKAIIHRDIKPSNILVTEVDGKPVPRIIDFGIAKPMSQGENARTQFTQIGSMVGTLGYMSPEQADSSGEDIDTRSDVYSLGVVLYELLVGTLPLNVNKLTFSEVLRLLREVDATRPSTGLRQMSDAAAVAERRSTDVASLSRQLRGDADAIALKALEKHRNRRYATPAELSADVERFLRDEPVLAHAPSFTYSAGKYLRRHKVGVIVAAAAILLLAGFAVAQTWQLRNVRRERDRADRIAAFMKDMFKVSNPIESRGNTITAREILDRSASQVEKEAGLDASVRSQLMEVMAETYMGLGLYDRARTLAERTVALQSTDFGGENPGTLASMSLLGTVLYNEGRDPEAETLLRKTIDAQTRVLGPQDPATLDTEDTLATVLVHRAKFKEAETLERSVIARETRKGASENPALYQSMSTLATALRGENRFDEAEKVYRQLLESERRNLGADHPNTLSAMQRLAWMLHLEGRVDDSESLFRQTLAAQRRVLGNDHPATAVTLSQLATTLEEGTPRIAEAETLFREALAIQLRAAGPDSFATTRSQEGLANVLTDEKRFAEAEPVLRQILATRQKILGPDHTDVLLTQYNLANVLWNEQKLTEADLLARKTLDQQLRTLNPDDLDIPITYGLLGRILLSENQPQQAEEFARKAFDMQLRLLGPQHPRTQNSLHGLVEVMVRLGHRDDARSLYLSTMDKINTLPDGHTPEVLGSMAETAVVAGSPDDAFQYLNQAVQAGPVSSEDLQTDDDLKPLRSDPRFAQLVLAAQSRQNKK